MSDKNTTIQWKVNLEGQDNLSQKFNLVQSSGEKLKMTVIALSEAYMAVSEIVQQAVEVYKELTEEYLKADAANTQLSRTLKAMGQDAKGAKEGIHEFAMQMQEVLGISKDTIQETISYNLALGMTVEQAEKATTAAAGYARAFGVDISSANQRLTQTLDGTVGRLGRTIIETKDLTESQLKHGAAIDIVNKKYADLLTGTNTPSELAKQITFATNEIKEAFGKGFFNADGEKSTLALLKALESTGFAENLGKQARLAVEVIKAMVGDMITGFKTIFDVVYSVIAGLFDKIKQKFWGMMAVLVQPFSDDKYKEYANNSEQAFQDSNKNMIDLITALSQPQTKDSLDAWSEWSKQLATTAKSAKEIAPAMKKIREELDKPTKVVAPKGNIDIHPPGDYFTTAKMVVDTVNGGLSAIITKIGDAFGAPGQFAAAVINFLNKTKEQMKEFINGLLDTILQLPENLAESIPAIIETIINRIPEIIERLIVSLNLLLPRIVMGVITAVISGIANILPTLMNIQFWEGIAVNLFTALSNVFKDFFSALFMGSSDKIVSAASAAQQALFNPTADAGTNKFQLKDLATERTASALNQGIDAVIEKGQKGLFQMLYEGIAGIFNQIIPSILNAFSGLGSFFYNLGSQIWNGFISPIGNFFYNLGSQIASGLMNNISGLGGIFSGGGILGGLSGLFGGGGSGSFLGSVGGAVSSVAGSLGFAEGGLVGGSAPFSGNSSGNDIIPAMLSPGEYVVNRQDMRNGNLSGVANAMGISMGGGISLVINIASGANVTESQLRRSFAPIIIDELKKASRNGQQVVSKKGIY